MSKDKEAKSPEELLTITVDGIVDSINKDRLDLEQQVKSAEDKGALLMMLFFKADEYLEFEYPEFFWIGISDLSEQIGHAQHMVLEIENKRKIIVEKIGEKTPTPTQTPQVIVSSTPAVVQRPGGITGWLETRTEAKSAEKIQERWIKAQQQGTPQIATERQVTDILDFGRQLIPEFNRLHLYFQQCLDHLHFFNDDETKAFFHGELRQHLLKLIGIIRSFCRTVVEYRKSVLDEIKMELAKSMTQIVVAEALAKAGRGGILPYFDPMADEMRKRIRD